jgi:hypothetical protein
MHHHHALALLLFSVVFAGFALFTLCTFAPKVHRSVNPAEREDVVVSALSGLPIRRRAMESPAHTNPFYVREGILLNSRANGATMTTYFDGNSERRTPVSFLFDSPIEDQLRFQSQDHDGCADCVSWKLATTCGRTDVAKLLAFSS